jgi:carboxyl-terminal processing protease
MRRLILLAALMPAAIPASPATGQENDRPAISGQDRSRGHRMLRRLRETLERYYYDSTYRGIDLDRHVAQTDSAIDAANSVPQMFAVLADFLGALDDSHTRFLPPGINVEVSYGWSWQMVGDDCHVVSVSESGDAKAKGLRVGDRVLAIDGIRPVRENLSTIGYVYYQLSPRPGMRVLVEHEGGERAELIINSKMTRRPPVEDLADLNNRRRYWEEAERSRPRHAWREIDSVLVWRLPAFIHQDVEIDRLMALARQHRWLILDLRGNSGGSVATLLRLLGHFFAEPFHAFTEVRRDSTVEQRVLPVGDGPFMGEAIVLIDSRSASASELTSRVLQMRNRAMIVGDRSAGKVMGSYQISLTLGSVWQERVVPFGMQVTVVDGVMPDSSRLEKAGVIPNVAALPTGADLAAKRDPAMQFALEMAGVKVTAAEAGKVLSR